MNIHSLTSILLEALLGGLGGECSPPPQSAGSLAVAFLGSTIIPWMTTMYGNDSKFCDAAFSAFSFSLVRADS